MKYLYYIFYILLVMACENKTTEQNHISIPDSPAQDSIGVPAVNNSIEKKNTEYLDWSMLKVNGKLPLLCNHKELNELLGEPDSIVVPNYEELCVSFFEKDFNIAYYGASHFDVYKDSAVVQSIIFNGSSSIFLVSEKITLSNQTTFSDLEKLFPKACQLKQEVNLYRVGKKMCIRLATSSEYSDDAWLLFFDEGKLIQIDYWMPC